MGAQWREIPRDHVRAQWATPYVSMNPKGEIVMSRFTHEKMGEPEAYLLLFDAVNNRIGMQAAAPKTRNAYPAGRFGRHGGKVIRALRLIHETGIDLPETVQFQDAHIDPDGLLILDLRTARVPARVQVWKKTHPNNCLPRSGPSSQNRER